MTRSRDDAESIFDGATVARLARDARLPTDADLARLRVNICDAAVIYWQAVAAPTDQAVRREIADLWRVADRAHPDCTRLAAMLESLSDRARTWLTASAQRRELVLPSTAALRNPRECDVAVVAILRACSFGGRGVNTRNRPSGRRSRSYVPELAAPPEPGPGRPSHDAERELLRWLAGAYVSAGGELPTIVRGPTPFHDFVVEIFELVGAHTGNLRRLVEEVSAAWWAMPSEQAGGILP